MLHAQEVAANLAGLLQAAAAAPRAAADTRERLNRALQLVSPVASAALPAPAAGPAPAASQSGPLDNGNAEEGAPGGEGAAAPDQAAAAAAPPPLLLPGPDWLLQEG